MRKENRKESPYSKNAINRVLLLVAVLVCDLNLDGISTKTRTINLGTIDSCTVNPISFNVAPEYGNGCRFLFVQIDKQGL